MGIYTRWSCSANLNFYMRRMTPGSWYGEPIFIVNDRALLRCLGIRLASLRIPPSFSTRGRLQRVSYYQGYPPLRRFSFLFS